MELSIKRSIFLTATCIMLSANISAQTTDFGYRTKPELSSTSTNSILPMGGQFSVGELGDAEYMIPIEVPQGINGLTPELGLCYSSLSGSGVCGVGFCISGVPSIKRVSGNPFFDGNTINMDDNTDFILALDGQRLIREKSTNTYFIENDPFTKLTLSKREYYKSHSLEVRMQKDGLEYLFEMMERDVYNFYPTSITDQYGNSIHYTYTHDNGYWYISKISYCDGLSEIEFVYQNTSRIANGFYKMPFEIRKNLSEIVVRHNSSLYRRYVLDYSSNNKKSLLSSVTEYNSDGNAKYPTIFTWGNEEIDLWQKESVSFPGMSPDKFQNMECVPGDFDGDGIDDIVFVEDSHRIICYRNNGNKSFSLYKSFEIENKSIVLGDSYFNNFSVANLFTDFNGDGVLDLILPTINFSKVFKSYNNQYYVQICFLSKSTNNATTIAWQLKNAQIPALTVGDYFGIGFSQVMIVERTKTSDNRYYFSMKGMRKHDDAGPTEHNFYLSLPGAPDRIYSSDFDGDGLIDILVVCSDGSAIFWNRGSASGDIFSDNSSTLIPGIKSNAQKICLGDFEGDGVADIACNPADNSSFYIYRNKGNRVFASSAYSNFGIGSYSNPEKYCVEIADINRDGRSDFLISKAKYEGTKHTFASNYDVAMVFDGKYFWTESPSAWKGERSSSYYQIITGDFDGDGYQEYMKLGTDNKWHISTPFGERDGISYNKIIKIERDNGIITTIGYKSLSDKSAYTKGTGSKYPVADISMPFSVVASVQESKGEMPSITTSYRYGGLKAHLGGRGLLGFSRREEKTPYSSFTYVVDDRDADYFVPSHIKTQTTTGQYQSSTSSEIGIIKTTGARYFSYHAQTEETDIYGNKTITTNKYNQYGCLLSTRTEYNDGNWKSVEYDGYQLIGNNYYPQFIINKQKHKDDPKTFSSKVYFEYDSKGSVIKRSDNYGSQRSVTEQYTYDSHGNISSKEVYAQEGTLSVNNYSYDPSHRLLIRQESLYPYTAHTFQYDNLGNRISETDVTDSLNKLVTQHKYNGWGQRLETISPDGTISSSVTGWEGQRYFIAEMGTATPWTKTFYDCAGNMVKEESIAFSASYSKPVLETSEYCYNRHGKVYLSHNYIGDNYTLARCQYDELGRLIQETDGDDTVSMAYGNRMIEKTVNGITTTMRYDSWDNVKSVTDPMLTTKFQYNSNGNPSLASAGDGRVSIAYTQEGLRESITDSDAGQETYEYDSFGRTTKHTNAKGIITANTYENGLLTKTVCGGVATTYAYDKMHRLIKQNNGTAEISYKYDRLGRPSKDIYLLDGKTFEYSYTYNSQGLPATKTFPDNTTEKYTYDSYGRHIKTNLDNAEVWVAFVESASGNEIRNTDILGNTIYIDYVADNKGRIKSIAENSQRSSAVYGRQNYAYSLRSNMISRQLSASGRDTFCYDAADRLIMMNDDIVEYSKSGNILYKSDMGAYEYSAPQPHAVTGVEDPNNIIKSLKQEYTYTPFKKPASISGTDLDGKAYSYTIHYGPDNDRIKTIYSKGSDRATTYYLPDYEVENRNGVVSSRHYIYTSKGNLAAINFASGGKNVLMYAVCDFQGSLLRLYDNDFRLKYSASYSPWGVRSILQNTTGFNIPRGYTMHEHLDEFGLINMNARLYDPYIARFLSPDPYIQDPENSQNFNRYSYCLNNPLKYTDPSGEFWQYILGGIFGGINGFQIGKSSGLSGWKLFGTTIVGAGIGVLSGGLGSSIASSGMPMANTISIMASSHITSVGMSFVGGMSGTNIPYSLSFGIGSLSISDRGVNLGYLWKKGNSKLENWGYILGGLANLSDVIINRNGQLVDLVTNHEGKCHSAIVGSQETYEAGFSSPDKLVSFGPNNSNNEKTIWCPGNSDWNTYTNIFEKEEVWRQSITANIKSLTWYSSRLNDKPHHYSWAISSCVSHASRALNISGVFNIGIHPIILHTQIWFRANGFRPSLFSYYLTNNY